MAKYRLECRLTEGVRKKMEELCKKSGKTQTVVVEDSLGFLHWIQKEMENGSVLLLEKDGKRREMAPFFFGAY